MDSILLIKIYTIGNAKKQIADFDCCDPTPNSLPMLANDSAILLTSVDGGML